MGILSFACYAIAILMAGILFLCGGSLLIDSISLLREQDYFEGITRLLYSLLLIAGGIFAVGMLLIVPGSANLG